MGAMRLGLPDHIVACLFDLDGVLTQTATVHEAAWKQMFDAHLQERAAHEGEPFRAFEEADYDRYVDGKPRYDGVRSFLESRDIHLPEGTHDDPPDAETIGGLGNRKNQLVLALIHSQGVKPYEGSVRYVHAVIEAGLKRAVVSSSTNCRDVLAAAGIADLFDTIVDGHVAEQRHLRGKPAPDTFLEAAKELGVAPRDAAVFEDALAGVGAGQGAVEARGRYRRLRPGGASGGTMIDHPAFPVHPWRLAETYLDLNVMAQTESLFALSNGHIGLRGNLDEGEPHAVPGSYLNSFYEVRPLPYAEGGYGYPEAGQTVVNVTNGKVIRLLVDDEPFDVRYGSLRSHRRPLDFRAGVLTREVEWVSPTGCAVRVRSTRLVSFTQRALVAIYYEVEPVDCTADIVVQSELVANEPLPPGLLDPRSTAVLAAPLVPQLHDTSNGRTVLVHATKVSGLRMAAGMDHVVEGPEKTQVHDECAEDLARLTVATR